MIKYCRHCVYPETKPDLSLDENGICDACRFVDVKDTTNWDLRRKELAEIIGKEIAKRTIEKGIKKVAFDKGKYKYHGIIKIIADAARSEGLNF